MKTCLITGGAGFIGSNLAKDLLDKGYKVVCIDDLSTGNMSNIKDLNKNPNFIFKKSDITKKISINENIDFIFHLASPSIPFDYLKNPLKTMVVNSLGTKNVLELANDKDAVFLLASSSDVYGDPLVHPQKEEHRGNVDHISRKSCYYEGKRFAETMARVFHKNHATDTRIARMFNTYGPNMRNEGTAISIFTKQALQHAPITINGTGKQKRTFCYVDDVVRGLESLMFSKHSGEIFNLGSEHEITISELAEYIKKCTKSRSKTIYKKMPEEDPMRVVPDITKAKRMLNWEPKTSLDDGLIKTIEWFKTLK